MPIDTIAPRYMQIGRIRIGERTERAARALTKPRITSPDKAGLEDLRTVLGGTVQEWDSPMDDRWELKTNSEQIAVKILPGQWGQEMELWSGGGCQRRCNGYECQLADRTEVPCMCPEDPVERMELAGDGKACKPTTRVNLLIDEWLGNVGSFRLETHSFYAAQELKALMLGLENAGVVRPVPAVLRVETRTVKRNGKTKKFVVPVLDVAMPTMQQAIESARRPELAGGEHRALPPSPPRASNETGPPQESKGDDQAPMGGSNGKAASTGAARSRSGGKVKATDAQCGMLHKYARELGWELGEIFDDGLWWKDQAHREAGLAGSSIKAQMRSYKDLPKSVASQLIEHWKVEAMKLSQNDINANIEAAKAHDKQARAEAKETRAGEQPHGEEPVQTADGSSPPPSVIEDFRAALEQRFPGRGVARMAYEKQLCKDEGVDRIEAIDLDTLTTKTQELLAGVSA